MAQPPSQAPDSLDHGRYRVLEALGAGGMGEVFRGTHVELGREVAIKRLRAEALVDESVVRRFINEARAVNLVRHENIVEVTDFFTDEGRVHMVMELLVGRSLGALIKAEGPLPFERAAHIGAQIADALTAAHEQKIVHRDLKPENVFLIARRSTLDYVKVLDFGIARLQPELGGIEATESGVIIGTPVYMAPEQAKGGKVGPAADLYALGIMLYEMLSGHWPFPRSSAIQMMMAHISEPPRALDVEGLPRGFAELIDSMLAKDPAARPASMRTVAEALETWARPTPNPARGSQAFSASGGAGGDMPTEDFEASARFAATRPSKAEVLVEAPASIVDSRSPSSLYREHPIRVESEPSARARKPRLWMAAAAMVLGIGGVLYFLVASRPRDQQEAASVGKAAAGELAAELTTLGAELGLSPHARSCALERADKLESMVKAARLLQGGKPGRDRPQDYLAWQELSAITEASAARDLWMARAALQLGQMEEAIARAQSASSQCSDLAAAYGIEGTAQAYLGDHESALRVLGEAVELDPDYIDARFNLGLSQLALNRVAEAVASFSVVLLQDPKTKGVRFLRGRSYLQLGETDKAVGDLEAAVVEDRESGAAWFFLGHALEAKGRADNAREAWCKAKAFGKAEAPCDSDVVPEGLPDWLEAPK